MVGGRWFFSEGRGSAPEGVEQSPSPKRIASKNTPCYSAVHMSRPVFWTVRLSRGQWIAALLVACTLITFQIIAEFAPPSSQTKQPVRDQLIATCRSADVALSDCAIQFTERYGEFRPKYTQEEWDYKYRAHCFELIEEYEKLCGESACPNCAWGH